ncbi:MAG: rod-binding protein [Betaproteobacteria bacterium]
MEPVNNANARSYLDFQGLGELKGQAARDGKAALRETAQQFEAMFLQMMMKSMRESIDKSDLVQSNHTETFEGMFDREVSVAMAKRNSMGLADMLVQNQERQMGSISTAEALQARDAGSAKSEIRRLDAPAQPLPLQAPPAAWEPLKRPGGPLNINPAKLGLGVSR